MQPLRQIIHSLCRPAAVAACFASSAGIAQVLPSGASVAAGQVTTHASGSALNISQASQSAIVNWQSFSIGAGNVVHVAQPNSGAVLLNRVTGNTASTLAGQLTANGQVFLVNPNGIAITPTGVVNVGSGLVASTLDITDEDFKSGRYRFSGTGALGNVVNQGIVNVGRGGYAALLGGAVNNRGLISVPLGHIGVGAGESATLDVSGDGFLQVAMPSTGANASGAGALIESSGRLDAAGGSIVLSSATARAAARNAINLSGVIEANSIGGRSGAIVLSGGEGGAVNLAAGSLITADAGASGNGGSVVITAGSSTNFDGTINARGGTYGGNGGQVEVSSTGTLGFHGHVDLSAAQGRFGDLLLDPYSITISNAVSGNGSLSGGSFTPSGTGSLLNVTELQNALASANVTVATGGAGSAGSEAGDITVASPITWSSGSTLTLDAYHSIAVNAGITVGGTGGLSLITNDGGSGGTVSFARGASASFSGTPFGTQSLSINRQSYQLLYSLDALQALPVLAGNFALATDLSAQTTYRSAVIPQLLGTLEGLGHTISNLTIDSTQSFVGLIGHNLGTVRDLGLLGGSVRGNSDVGALVGSNEAGGNVLNDYATATVSGSPLGSAVGGLVGANLSFSAGTATIFNSFATGAVSGGYGTGGLVGINGCDSCGGSAVVSQVYAMGAVGGAQASNVGGLIGRNGGDGQVSNAYSTGAVAGSGYVGGSIGYSYGVNGLYWDTTTGGNLPSTSNSTANVTALSTAQLQGGSQLTMAGFAGGAAGGVAGVYPYLTSFYPNGVQTISGIAYQDGGHTVLASNVNAAAPVTVTLNGALAGASTTGVNGYYYLALPAGTLATPGVTALVYTTADANSGARNGARLGILTDTTTGFDVNGGDLHYSTAATTYSGALAALAPIEAYASTPAFLASLAPDFTATGASFTLDRPITTAASVRIVTTAANAALTVAAPIALSGTNDLVLQSSGSLAVNAPITLAGTTAVTLNYDASSVSNLSFALGDSIDFGAHDAGGTLAINGQSYHLLYKLTDSIASTGNGTDSGTDDIAGIDNNTAAGRDAGYYALATSVAGTGSAAAPQFSHSPAGSGSASFTGVFEGLGNTVANLTIAASSDVSVGLFGTNTAGTIRDVGVVGGSVTNSYRSFFYSAAAGGLVGTNGNSTGHTTAIVANAFSTADVVGTNFVGGLVGYNRGYNSNATVTHSFVTGAVSGGQYDGGLVGFNLGNGGTGLISDSYASGAVSGGYYNGSVLAFNDSYGGPAIVSNVYSTGALSGASYASGGVIGYTAGTISHAYWDLTSTGSGNGSGHVNGSGPTTSVSTAQLQGTASGSIVLDSAFSGGAAGGMSGVYPYLTSFYPNGVQAVSGIAFTDAGTTPLTSGASGAGRVGVVSAGRFLGQSTTGANGAYYLALPTGTLVAGQNVIAYTQANGATGSTDAANLVATGAGAVTAANVYGATLRESVGSSVNSLSALNSAYTTAAGTTAAAGLTPANLALDAAGTFTVDRPIAVTGTVSIGAAGDLTLASTGSVSGASPVLATTGAFINEAGSGGLTASSGRWLVYSSAPSVDRFGGLDSANTPIFGATLSSASPSSITASGDRYVFANRPMLTVTSTDATKVYGTDGTAALLGNYTVSGFVTAVPGAFLAPSHAEVLTGSPGVNSAGAAVGAGVAQGPYGIIVTAGTLTSPAGYSLNFQSSGLLNVTPAPLTVTGGTGLDKVYDASTALPTGVGTPFTSAGILAADVGRVSVSATGAVYDSANAGMRTIDISGLTLSGAAAANYALTATTATGTGSISPAVINLNGTRAYDGGSNANAAVFGAGVGTGMPGVPGVPGGTVTLTGVAQQTLTLSGLGTLGTKDAGVQSLASLGTLALGDGTGLAANYTLAAGTQAVTVTPALVTVSGSTGIDKVYDATTALPANVGALFTTAGILPGDAAQVTVSAAPTQYASANAGTQAIDLAGLTLTGLGARNYTLTSTSASASGRIAPAPVTVTGASGIDKGYDGTTTLPAGATAFSVAGILPADETQVSVIAAQSSYAAAASGAETVNITGLALSGAAAGNYQLTTTQALGSGTIAAAPVTAAVAPAVVELASTLVQANEQSRTGVVGDGALAQVPLDTARGWQAVDALGSPGFDQAIACVKARCMSR